MKHVKATSFPSETASLKNDIRLLWVLVFWLVSFLIYSEARFLNLKSQVTPQAMTEACNSAKEAR